ncbi:hypothetical protein SISNIDRAFT_451700, partial [Sistotremastrum niveocremeum HHB9708]
SCTLQQHSHQHDAPPIELIVVSVVLTANGPSFVVGRRTSRLELFSVAVFRP